MLNGHFHLEAERRADGRTILARQSFRAPFHLSKPYWDGQSLLVQVVNPTAGILAGDRLESSISVGAGAGLVVTTPSASRVFQMKEGSADAQQVFTVKEGGWLEFLPEPIVPHAGSSYRQRTMLEIEAGGEAVYADFLMPGRMARGEAWAWSRLQLELTVRLGGQLVLRERFCQSGAELRKLADLTGAGDGASFGNIVLVSASLRSDSTWRTEIEALHGEGLWVGVSPLAGDGDAWSLKVVAPDSIHMRQCLKKVRAILAQRLPRLNAEMRKL